MNGFTPIVRTLAAALLLAAAAPGRAQQVPLQDKPFAEHKIVLQLSDNDPNKQGLVISVANNLMKFYDPDKVAIEIVAFGPGIDLLSPENPNRKAVESLVAQGVRVDICLNTVDTLERESRQAAGIHCRRNAGAGRRRTNPASDRERLHAGQAMMTASERRAAVDRRAMRYESRIQCDHITAARTRRWIASIVYAPRTCTVRGKPNGDFHVADAAVAHSSGAWLA